MTYGTRIGLILLFGLLGVVPAGASSLRSDILELLPQESGQVAFVDLQELRRSPHYRLLKQRLVPPRFAHFERFVRSMGVEVDNDLEWLAWVLVPPGPERPRELFLGLAQGQFAPEKVEKIFRRQKLPLAAYHGFTFFPFGSGAGARDLFFTFVDSSTAVFGTRPSLELLVETHFGTHENLLRNESLLARLTEVNGHTPVWVVLDQHYTELAMHQVVPEAAKFQEFTGMVECFHSSLLRAEVGQELTFDFDVWCEGALDAQLFSLLLQTGFAAQAWQVQESNPDFAALLQRTDVHSSGDRLQVRLTVRKEEVRALLDRFRR